MHQIFLILQFIVGLLNIIVDGLNCKDGVLVAEWTFMSKDLSGDSQSVVFYDRPLCHQAQSSTSSFLLSVRHIGFGSRFNVTSLVQFDDLCFPLFGLVHQEAV